MLVGFILVCGFLVAEESANYKTFGAPSALKGDPLTLKEALQPAQLGKPVKLQAVVKDVCRNKGCWMMLTDEKTAMRVTFKNYGFFVPKEILDKNVIVEGVINEKEIPESEARHYAMDAGKTEEEINKIVGSQKEYAMIAETVLLPEASK